MSTRIIIDEYYPNTDYNSHFEENYPHPPETQRKVSQDFEFLIQCVNDYEQIQNHRLTDENLTFVQVGIIMSKVKEINRIKSKYKSLAKYIIETANDTL
jgi:hypothetical protein